MKIEEHTVIEGGEVMGYVMTDMVGSKVTFPICSVEEWEDMDAEQAEMYAQEAIFNCIEWGY